MSWLVGLLRRSWQSVPHTVLTPAAWLVVGLVAELNVSRFVPTARPVDALGIALIVLGPLLLVVRRAHPPAVLVACTAVLLVYLALGYPFGPVVVPSLVALAEAIVHGHRRVAYATTVVAVLAGLAIQIGVRGGLAGIEGRLGWLAWLAAYVAGCELWRARTERRAQARAAREETARRQAGEERLRIARELHDVLGHHVSLINVQAGVALYLLDDDPEQARRALATIKDASRDLLREMRSTLGVLRGVDDEPPRAPTAGLGMLDRLVADNEAAGLAVSTAVDADVRALPPSVDLAAYRIVQEALTNVRKHAGAARALVKVTEVGGALRVVVDDDGAGPSARAGEGGAGLVGMHERATALGGTLSHGRAPGGGFRVEAVLPLTGPRPAPVGPPGEEEAG
ncbi:sensor histidine kinase [Pseudonocardia sp. RS11V-5]|uniref:sensor histidine kinase n=1 Tax=Pseudonocardia terrae TaxID=2905831 RepID=UPI001E5D319D|nr:sensor histidine kinase [Pseudonocardia terrae]MCE3552905.1 sensor histidine kinase [Pseudonocardia terrae]